MTLELLPLIPGSMLLAVIGWVILNIFGFFTALLREWVDDFDRKYPNPVLLLAAKLEGWHYDHERNLPYRGPDDCSDGSRQLFGGMIVAAILAPLSTISYFHPGVAVGAAALAVTLFTARFVKRLKKKFDLHTADKNAHQ